MNTIQNYGMANYHQSFCGKLGPFRLNRRCLSPEQVKALNEKSTKEAITKMNEGDKTVKTQEYYDELFKEIDNSVTTTVSYDNPRPTGGITSFHHYNPALLVQTYKGSVTNPSGYAEMKSIYDWGSLGLFRATRKCELPFDGAGYNTVSNSVLERFNKESGKWENIDYWSKSLGLSWAEIMESRGARQISDSIESYFESPYVINWTRRK